MTGAGRLYVGLIPHQGPGIGSDPGTRGACRHPSGRRGDRQGGPDVQVKGHGLLYLELLSSANGLEYAVLRSLRAVLHQLVVEKPVTRESGWESAWFWGEQLPERCRPGAVSQVEGGGGSPPQETRRALKPGPVSPRPGMPRCSRRRGSRAMGAVASP